MKKILVSLLVIFYAIIPVFSHFYYPGVGEVNSDNIKKLGDLHSSYDVVVIGGEPEGVAAAVAAARNGQSTLLVAQRDGLGGLMTYGMLNFLDISYDKNGTLANLGIFKEWYQLIGSKIGFDIPDAKNAFLKLVDEEDNLTLVLETYVQSVIKQDNRLTGVHLIDQNGTSATIQGERFIDATQDADLAVMAGAPYFNGGADIGLEDRKMAVTLMMHFKNVDWNELKRAAKDGVFGGGEVSGNVAWGFSDLHYDYKPHHPNTRLRGLNVVKQQDDSIVINALQIFDINGLDERSRQEGIEIGKRETAHILEFFKENFPGFKNAEIASFPEELYVRETRHILAEYQLPMSDVWENRDHWDSIGFGAYPVDVQATSVNNYGYVINSPVQYAIPFRSLVPLEVDGLLVVSKAAGYSSLAAGSARVLPTGMTSGQAAGVASAISIDLDVSFREMTKQVPTIQKLQAKLKEQGANLYHYVIEYPYQGEWFYPSARTLLNYGLLVGGYQNVLPVDKPISELSFVNLLSSGVKRVSSQEASSLEINLDAMRALVVQESELTREKAAEFILTLYGESESKTNAWEQVQGLDFIDKVIIDRLKENRVLVGAEAYYIAGKLLDSLK